jgi:opacity protein-like surface antigen
MSRSNSCLLVGLLVLMGITMTTVPADAQSGGFGIGAHYSWVRNQDTEESSGMFGAMARLRGEVVGVEGAIDYRNEEMGGGVDLKTWPITASLMIYPVPVIYALGGLGWYNSTLDFPDGSLFEDQTDTQLGYHLGAGMELPVSPNLRLTGDFRYHFVDYEFDDIPSSIGNVDADAFSLNGGVLIYLK